MNNLNIFCGREFYEFLSLTVKKNMGNEPLRISIRDYHGYFVIRSKLKYHDVGRWKQEQANIHDFTALLFLI